MFMVWGGGKREENVTVSIIVVREPQQLRGLTRAAETHCKCMIESDVQILEGSKMSVCTGRPGSSRQGVDCHRGMLDHLKRQPPN